MGARVGLGETVGLRVGLNDVIGAADGSAVGADDGSSNTFT